MAVYKIQSGDTLGKIASQYGTTVDALAKANNIANPNLIYAGASLEIPNIVTPSVYSSSAARDTTTKNLNTLSTAETTLLPYTQNPNIAPYTNSPQTNQNAGVQVPYSPSYKQSSAQPTQATAPVQTANPINYASTNPSLQSIIDQTNAILKSVPLSPENKSMLDQINAASNARTVALSDARTAEQNGDYKALNTSISDAKMQEDTLTSLIKNFQTSLSPLREKYLSSLLPSQQETDLQTELAKLRKEANDYELSRREGAQSEYGLGRPLAISTGRSEKLLQQTQNTSQNYINKEKNLLERLGFAQEARKATAESAKAGISVLNDSLELKLKVYEAIGNEEKAIIDKTNQMSDNARQTLSTILTQFKGLTIDELPADTQVRLSQLALNAGIDLETLSAGMKAVKNQLDYQNLTKDSGSVSERLLSAKSAALQSAKTELSSSKGKDGYVDPARYQELRSEFVISGLGDAKDFDSAFKSLLSPNEQNALFREA